MELVWLTLKIIPILITQQQLGWRLSTGSAVQHVRQSAQNNWTDHKLQQLYQLSSCWSMTTHSVHPADRCYCTAACGLLSLTFLSPMQRIVYVDNPDLGYVKGNQEIPAGAAFELEVEVLSAVAGKSS